VVGILAEQFSQVKRDRLASRAPDPTPALPEPNRTRAQHISNDEQRVMNVEGSTFPEQAPAASIIRYSPVQSRYETSSAVKLIKVGFEFAGTVAAAGERLDQLLAELSASPPGIHTEPWR